MKAYKMSEGIAALILNLGTRWRRVFDLTSQPLYPWGKSPQHPLNRRLAGLQIQSGHFSEEINVF
jgi:hypothetical protein